MLYIVYAMYEQLAYRITLSDIRYTEYYIETMYFQQVRIINNNLLSYKLYIL